MEKSVVVNRINPTERMRSAGAVFGRITLFLIYATCLLLTLASTIPRFRWLTEPYAGEQYDFLRMTTRHLPDLGISPTLYATIGISTELLAIGLPLALATFIFIRLPRSLYPQFCAVMLVATAFTTHYPIDAIKFDYPILIPTESTLQAWAILSGAIFMFTFPSGRFEPRWLWLLIIPKAALLLYFLIFPDTPGNYLQAELAWQRPQFAFFEITTSFLIGFIAQLYRYFKISTAIEQQQTKWLILGVGVSFAGWMVRNIAMGDGNLDSATVVLLIWVGSFVLLARPLALGVAITRYRLWDIDRLVSLTIVYTGLIVTIIGIYVVSIAGFQQLLGTQSPLSGGIALVIAALLFQPLRDRLQQLASRYLFGERDDPTKVLNALGQRLETVVDSAEILPTVVDTLTKSLRIPYAAITMREGSSHTIAAEQGTPTAHSLTLPLLYQGASVGELRVAQRSDIDPFNARDHELLETVAKQTSAAVRAIQLTRDLQRSRLNLVTTREEERRRLRRDLHDGLGPTLAAQMFRIGAIRNNLEKNPARSLELLNGLEKAINGTLTDVRRVVYALRPPLLDQLGLLGAVNNFAGSHSAGFKLHLDLPEALPPLNAATEVAAFRIVQTALDNVAQHANAQHCTLSLSAENNYLIVQISDDGRGMPPDVTIGVGLVSMRERTEELGGTFTTGSNQPSGTIIHAAIPIETDLEHADD